MEEHRGIEEQLRDRLYNEIVIRQPFLWWWIKDKKAISTEIVVEGVLANGDMDEVLNLFEILGRENVKKIFFNQISRKRHNYRPQTVNLFRKAFSRNV
ncbi:MAG: hypothetical protein C4530_18295 [Desulfobacteraceae bacterium]|nr:MAG: hypothetical protein C4530_18295 [Desulfobacteraceae bacterium]